ncbi:MAG: PBP1A family penicillin-binding protein, partial [Christensenellaceae bacterium]|nr:PBP1A family penicillin-binding protein [Christensenellaceae bacterium]
MKMKKFWRILKYLFLTGVLLLLKTGCFLLSYLMGIEEWKTYDPQETADLMLSSEFFDNEGEVFARLYAEEDRLFCEIESLPEHVKNAFIAIEDARFYTHPGIDIIRIGGALIEDLRSGSLAQGASTISQQVVKLSALSGKRTISRKLTEIMMAFKLEQRFSKDEILELYLNIAYFGNGAYGIETAAEKYFGKNAAELSVSEAATLAGIVKAPSNYAPHIKPENSLRRRNLVLSQMLHYGFISQKDYEKARTDTLVLTENTIEDYPYGYYLDYALIEAKNILGIPLEKLYSGGYRIYTALDQTQQKAIEEYAKVPENFPENAADGEAVQCAAVMLDAKTGAISAMIGGREHKARLSFSRAYQMQRQPGSALKPILVFAPAVEYLGLLPTNFLLDVEEDFGGFLPKEKNYAGWMTLRDVCAYSTNIPAVRLLSEIGVERAKRYAESVGIPFTKEDMGLSLALGGMHKGLSPLELASSYLPFASGGRFGESYTITKICDKNGNILYEKEPSFYSVLSEKSAYLVSSMLSSAAEYGTAKHLYMEDIPLAAKTGTSSFDSEKGYNRDAWIAAYNPEFVFCCWVGFDKTDGSHYLEQGVTGGNCPAAFAKYIFSEIYKNRTAPDFSIPYGIESAEIDKYILETQKRTVLSTEQSIETFTEFFTRENLPKERALYFSQEPPGDFKAEWQNFYPIISFTGQKDLVYAL